MSEGHQQPTPDQVYVIEAQEVTLADFPAEGFILDIGGGGEGIIGQLKGTQVVAIDPIQRELAESPAGPLKIVMDGSDLKFLDGAFQNVTAFFSFMFMPLNLHAKVLTESYRVLAPGGRFRVWDVVVPPKGEHIEAFFAFHLQISLPGSTVSTGYGLPWPAEGFNLEHYLLAAQAAGFKVVVEERQGPRFYLELEKPNQA
jgi:SAM-dependent methyltransferase